MIFYSISTIQFLNRAPNEENFDFYLSFFLILLHLSLLDTPDNEEKKKFFKVKNQIIYAAIKRETNEHKNNHGLYPNSNVRRMDIILKVVKALSTSINI